MDDEIIIGVGNNNSKNKENLKKKNSSKNKKKKKVKTKKILVIFLVVAIIVGIYILLINLSCFNVKNIEIQGNTLLSNEKIIELSEINNSNIFKVNKTSVKKNLLSNAYIEDVTIHKKFPSSIEIEISERVPTFMLQFSDSYVYIDNQGYMLEISNEKLEIPIIVGFITDLNNIKLGNRIDVDDLYKLNIVIQICDVAESCDLNNLITKVDISNDSNYTLEMTSEGKTIYLGDCSDYSDLKTRMLYLKSIIDNKTGKEGEIFLNMDLNSENPYFREKVD